MTSNGDSSHELDVLVIGAGFGGCYMLHLLRKNGYKTKVVEAAKSPGGVWAWNRYPGARVDCEFPYYGFSDPDIWNTFEWTERYPDHSQLRRYFEHVADVWDLRRDMELETTVKSCEYREGASPHWIVKTSKGSEYKCKWLVSATGTSFKQYMPEWKGRESFEGVLHHSSLWPHNVDLAGKRVAVIGAGSTGVQIVQEASKVAASVTQFIRTPNIALPMRQRQITIDEIYTLKPCMPHVFKALRHTSAGQHFDGQELNTFDVDEKERLAFWDEQWKRGGFHWLLAGRYQDTLVSPEANRAAYDYWVAKTAPRIKDPKKRELLVPSEPPYYLGSKRPSLEQDYYECCDLPHVEITDSPIVEFTKTGIVTEEKERGFDVVAVCTGYDAVTGGLRTMNVQGRGGIDLDTKWKDGISTHLGMVVKDFPNFFMLYGPQAPTSLTNGPPFLEMQVEWVIDVLNKQRTENIETIEPKQSEEDAWREECAHIANQTLAMHTNSWYNGGNVPGKKKEMLIYLGGVPAWHKACEEALESWKGFDVKT